MNAALGPPCHPVTVLLSDHEKSVELRPLGYQFATTVGDPHDDEPVVIGGDVATLRAVGPSFPER